MIQDTDEQMVERVHEELYDIKYARQAILDIMNASYNELLADANHNDYSVVQGAFRIHFEHPIELKYTGGKTVTTETLGVGFYLYEYREMLESLSDSASLKLAGYRQLGLNPIVEKTLNNFNIKLREKGLKLENIRKIRFMVAKL